MRGTETERKSQTELQTGLFVPILIQPKRLISFGGRTRTRTLDPLIKSLHYYIELTMVFSQLGQKVILRQQSVTSDFPTAENLTLAHDRACRFRSASHADVVLCNASVEGRGLGRPGGASFCYLR
jgi:hypothetical protein